MNVFDKYFSGYKGTMKSFSLFHNEVINMPRDQFSDTGLEKIKMLAKYLLLTKDKLDYEGVNYKDIMLCLRNSLHNANFKERDYAFEKRYLEFDDIDTHYKQEGRMFRHQMALSMFFGFISSISRQKKVINYDKCLEFALSDSEVLMPIARNNLLSLNTKDNDFLKALSGANITNETDYKPTFAILRYLRSIKRPVTKFEIATLLGRVGELTNEKDILERALEVGKVLPAKQKEQVLYFFSNMSWKNSNGTFYPYVASQEPYFKFNSYLLLMQSFDLINIDDAGELCTLTDYSNKLLDDDISYLIADLQNLLNRIDSDDEGNSRLNDIILYQRNPELMELAKSDRQFFVKINKRSLKNHVYDKNGKRIRNRLIAELAKIEVDYICQYSLRHTFKIPNGKYYCEAHHILEFSTENGPDITNNMIVLGPEAHKLLHYACQEEIDNAYLQLIKNGVFPLERFKEMIKIYNCLTEEHIDILLDKKIITSKENTELKELLTT